MSAVQTALLATLLYGLPWDGASNDSPERPAITDDDGWVLGALEAEAAALLEGAGIEGLVTGRIKSRESLESKARRKGLAVSDVLDRVALRIRVETVEDCYDVLDRLAARFSMVVGASDDYIAHPKANGYQSLHAAVVTPFGVAEFQVRTHDMHAHAETGGAAHARYKALVA